MLKSPPAGRDQKLPPILVLVICPTRELANQAATEAKTLIKYHPSVDVQVVMGGTRLAVEQKRMQANPCQVRYVDYSLFLFLSLSLSRDFFLGFVGFVIIIYKHCLNIAHFSWPS